MIAPSVPMAPELKCVSGFCLPRGYKKLETPITEGKYRKSTTSHNSIPLLLLVSNHIIGDNFKVEKISKGSLDSIPSPSPSVKIQIKGGKFCLRCKGKTLLGVVNKLLKTKSLLTSPSNVLPY